MAELVNTEIEVPILGYLYWVPRAEFTRARARDRAYDELYIPVTLTQKLHQVPLQVDKSTARAVVLKRAWGQRKTGRGGH